MPFCSGIVAIPTTDALGRTAFKPTKRICKDGLGRLSRWTVPKISGEDRAGAHKAARQRGNGVVQRALVKALTAAARPMGVDEAQVAVEALLGHRVLGIRSTAAFRPAHAVGRPASSASGRVATGYASAEDRRRSGGPGLELVGENRQEPTVPRHALDLVQLSGLGGLHRHARIHDSAFVSCVRRRGIAPDTGTWSRRPSAATPRLDHGMPCPRRCSSPAQGPADPELSALNHSGSVSCAQASMLPASR